MNPLVINYIRNLKDLRDIPLSIEMLRKEKDLSIEEKNLIYLYLYPRPLLDKELPYRIQEARKSQNNISGYLEPNLLEVSLIIEAYRGQQYNRFTKHLLHSFVEAGPEAVHPINGNSIEECALCGKNIFEFEAWENECRKYKSQHHPEEERKEYLAFGALGSNIGLCLDCIVQLQEVNKILEAIEPGYLKAKNFYV